MKKVKIMNLVKKAGVILPTIYYGNARSLIVNATDADIDWIANSANAADSSFMNLADTAKKEGAGVYQLFLIIGIVGVMCFGTWLGFLTAVSKNSNKREENKTQFIYLAIGGIVLFGIPAIIGGLRTIGVSLEF